MNQPAYTNAYYVRHTRADVDVMTKLAKGFDRIGKRIHEVYSQIITRMADTVIRRLNL